MNDGYSDWRHGDEKSVPVGCIEECGRGKESFMSCRTVHCAARLMTVSMRDDRKACWQICCFAISNVSLHLDED